MVHSSRLLTLLLILALPLVASAQLTPSIGLYFDENATDKVGEFEVLMPVDAYICVLDAQMMVAGAAFQLVVPSNALAIGTTYPPGLAIGRIDQGVELGMTTALPGFTGVVLVASLQMLVTAGSEADLLVVNHPNYATPIISDFRGLLFESTGVASIMVSGTANTTTTWGDLKSIYR